MPATPAFWRNPFQVNTGDTDASGNSYQRFQSVTQLSNGNILIAWQSNASVGQGTAPGVDVLAQILDPAGNKVGAEFRLNTVFTGDDEQLPSIVADANGGFTVVYRDVAGASDNAIRLEAFNAAGLLEAAQTVASDTVPGGYPDFGKAQIAGSLQTPAHRMIVYAKDNGGGDEDVYFRLWHTQTETFSDPVLVFNGVAGLGSGIDSVAVTALTNGHYAVAYSDRDGFSKSDVGVAIFSGAGVPVAQMDLAPSDAENEDVAVAALRGGNRFVAVWNASGAGGDTNVRAQLMANDGALIGGEIDVHSGPGQQQEASVAALRDLGFVIAWIENGTAVKGQRFDNDGVKIGNEFTVTTGTPTIESLTVTGLEDGRFTVTWTAVDGSDSDIRSAIMDARDTPVQGGAGNNVVAGTTGDDTMIGGTGEDRMYGGAGHDTIDPGAQADHVDGGGGNDTVSYKPYTGAMSINLASGTGTGGAADGDTYVSIENVIGGVLGDQILGNGGNNVLDGWIGADTVYGGGGNDTIIGGQGDDLMFGGAGADHFMGSGIVSYADFNWGNLTISLADPTQNTGAAAGDTYASNFTIAGGLGNDTIFGDGNSQIIYGGGGNDTITGNGGSDTLYGEDGDDVLEGSSLTDNMRGGAGNDVYKNVGSNDIIFELANEGTDAVQAVGSFSLALFAHVENLTLLGTDNFSGGGNEANNAIVGNDGNNNLFGSNGNDTLFGGLGQDYLEGGFGDDVFIITAGSGLDPIFENAGQGTDTVESYISYSLLTAANVENLRLVGISDANGDGNSTANAITGNSGKNKLTGLGGADTLDGGGGQDTLEGNAGADMLIGGADADVYINPIFAEGDTIVESAAGGIDTVKSNATISIDGIANLENVTLTGATAIDATGNGEANVLTGNGGHNALSGGANHDTLIGGDGADTLTGGGGEDSLEGGKGNDTYVDPNLDEDVIVELAGGGIDTVSSMATITLANVAEVENLVLTGADDINGTGNALDNKITGSNANNRLNGLNGDDILIGAGGNDTLNGGAGADTFRFAVAGTGTDTINNFETAIDRFDLTGGMFTAMSQSAGNTALTHAGGKIVLIGVTGLTLAEWNALVLPAGGAASADANMVDDLASLKAATPLDPAALEGWAVFGGWHHPASDGLGFMAAGHLDFA